MKFGLRSKVFLVALSLVALSVAVAFSFARAEAERDARAAVEGQLLTRLKLATMRVESEAASGADLGVWDGLADRLGAAGNARVTIVDAAGKVLGDSDVPLATLPSIRSHRARPEISAALEGRVSFAERTSETTSRPTLYIAGPVRFPSKASGVVRVAIPQSELIRTVTSPTRTFVMASLLALLLALVPAAIAADIVSRPLRSLIRSAGKMAEGDLAARVPALGGDEHGKLGEILNQLTIGLSKTLDDLRSERDRMGGILASMEEGALFLDSDGRIAIVNPALREMLFISGDCVGKRLLEVVRHAELKELLDSVWDEELEEGGEVGTAQGEIRLTGLYPRQLIVRARRLEGMPAGIVAVFLDVTETRRLEALRREFVANVSHELRTPVTSIRSAAETLHVALERDVSAANRFVDIIDRNASRLQALVEDLLDLSRIESRQYSLTLVEVDPLDACEHVVELFAERAARRQIKLIVDVAPETPPLRADRRALERVLTNLVDNAVKYAGEGREVRLSATGTEEHVFLTVADNGQGIEERHLTRLFERFYRVDAGRSRDVGGTGLGLSIVKNLVESMGGAIHVESEVHRGTRFRIKLPASLPLS